MIVSYIIYLSGLICLNIYYVKQLNELKKQLSSKNCSISILKHSLDITRRRNYGLGLEIAKLESKYDTTTLKSAVKYALKCTHPDNGGSSEEFTKFKLFYDSIK